MLEVQGFAGCSEVRCSTFRVMNPSSRGSTCSKFGIFWVRSMTSRGISCDSAKFHQQRHMIRSTMKEKLVVAECEDQKRNLDMSEL